MTWHFKDGRGEERRAERTEGVGFKQHGSINVKVHDTIQMLIDCIAVAEAHIFSGRFDCRFKQ
jgi:hypothetical protein